MMKTILSAMILAQAVAFTAILNAPTRRLSIASVSWPWTKKKSTPKRMPTTVTTDSQDQLAADKTLEMVFKNNNAWRRKMLAEDSKYFDRLANGQNPQILWIGCSDSRVCEQNCI